MFKIGICDDMPAVCNDVRDMVMRHPRHEEMSVMTFNACEEVCDFLLKGHAFDLLLLDIEFPGLNGLDMGNFLRNSLHDTITQIIFISAKDGYDRQLFDYQPLNFLKKPVNEDKLHTCITQAMAYKQENGPCLEVSLNRILHRIPLHEICYLESHNRQMVIHTTNKTYNHYGRLDDLALTKDFVRIHQSYVINLYFVRCLRFEKVTMSDGKVLPVSRTFRQNVRECGLRGNTL